MMRAKTLVRVMALALWIVQPISAQSGPASDPGLGPPLDSRLLELTRGRLIRIDYGGLPPLEGELLAVDDRSMWLLSDGQTRNISFDGLSEIKVRQHGFGAKEVWTWIGIGAAVTGIGMTAACASLDDDTTIGPRSCAVVFLATTLSWGIVGTLFSLNVVGSRWSEVPPVSEDLLRFSRFPQGLPEGYGR